MKTPRFMLSLTLLFALPLVFALAASSPVLANEMDSFKAPDDSWAQASKNKELVIFTKDNEAAGVREIRAHTFVDAPPAAVFKAVGDFNNYADYMPYVKESKILKKDGNTLSVYSRLDPPLVSQRDYIIEVKLSPGNAANGGVYKSEWKGTPEAQPERNKVVRVRLNTGAWTLEPADGGKRTRLTYSLLTNPGGSIPRWIADKSNTVAIPDLFKAVKKRAASEASASASK